MIERILSHSFSLLNADRVTLDSKWNYKNVISPYHRIYYIADGAGEISHFEKRLQLETGYLYIIPSFTLCNLHCKISLDQFFVQFFEDSPDGISLFSNSRSIFKVKALEGDKNNFERLLSLNPGRGLNRSDDPTVYEKDAYYKEYKELNNQYSTAQLLETQGILLQLVSRFAIPEIVNKKLKQQIPVKILDTINYIAISLHLPLSVKSLAERVHQNPEYFSRLFDKSTGIRPLAYINEKRIERAQYLIMTTRAKFVEIAEITGFESLSNFSRTFKKVTGISPNTYKKNYGSISTEFI
ncbi:MAG: AraC family transcriptional regulator [Pedobacter sp.]|nr:MAG: AraC family transcriptional regulator [Pedobacter sp.]